MGRDRVSGPPPSDHRGRRGSGQRKAGPSGLKVIERDGHWHVYGTVRAKGHTRRLRKSTDLPALPATWDAAQTIRRRWEGEILDEFVHGAKPKIATAIAADQFLRRARKRPLNARDIAIIQDIVVAFGERRLAEIGEGEWSAFIDNRNAGNKPETRERYITGVAAFLRWCHKRPRAWLDELPAFERDQAARKPKHRRARRVADLTPELIMLMIEHAAPHLAGQLVAEWSTGARLSSILFGCRLCDLALPPGREQLTFHDTKSGEPVVAALHPWAAEQLRRYLDWRGDLHDREAPLFVTPRIDRRTNKKLPYSDRLRGAAGGQNKTAFSAMKRRTIKALRHRAAAEARALWRGGRRETAWEVARTAHATVELVAQVTQHWFRHLLATTVMATSGNLRAAMDQGGWLTAESVLGYTHDVPEVRRRLVGELPIGAPGAGTKRAENKP